MVRNFKCAYAAGRAKATLKISLAEPARARRGAASLSRGKCSAIFCVSNDKRRSCDPASSRRPPSLATVRGTYTFQSAINVRGICDLLCTSSSDVLLIPRPIVPLRFGALTHLLYDFLVFTRFSSSSSKSLFDVRPQRPIKGSHNICARSCTNEHVFLCTFTHRTRSIRTVCERGKGASLKDEPQLPERTLQASTVPDRKNMMRGTSKVTTK